MQKALIITLIFLAFSSQSFAEITGIIDTSTSNNSFITGLYGYTVWYCNSNSDCISSWFKCLSDYDGVSNTGYAGWCVSSSETVCVHNSSASAYYEKTNSGSNICINSTAYLTCSSGIWSETKICSTGYVCIEGSCSQQTSSSSSSSTSNYSASFIKITGYPSYLNADAGSNFTTKITVTNGNTTQRNLSLNIIGVNSSWYLLNPDKISIIYARESATFNLSFFIPERAEAGEYLINIIANTSNYSVTDSVSFILNVISYSNVENVKKISIEEYENKLKELIEKFASLNNTMEEVKRKRVENLIAFTRSKIEEAKDMINKKEYSIIGPLIEEIEELLGEIEKSIQPMEKDFEDSDFLVLMAVVIIISAAGIAAFIFWPRKKEGYDSVQGYIPSKKGGYYEKIKRVFKKNKKEEAYINGKTGKK